jgi:hypothetical protein
MSLIKEIIENLTEGTLNNDIEWKLTSSLFNSDTQKYFETLSVDGLTKFTVQIYLKDDFKYRDSNFHIKNQDLVNGYKILLESEYKEIKELGLVVYEKYIKPTIPQKNEDDTYKSILSNIFSKQHKRDQRIDAILSDVIPTTSESDTKSDDKPKSILDRLFGK